MLRPEVRKSFVAVAVRLPVKPLQQDAVVVESALDAHGQRRGENRDDDEEEAEGEAERAAHGSALLSAGEKRDHGEHGEYFFTVASVRPGDLRGRAFRVDRESRSRDAVAGVDPRPTS